MATVTVVGAGVIGLSAAHELAVSGHKVTVVADLDTSETVSAVAAALWFPYRAERSEAADELLRVSLARFVDLSQDSDAPVDLRSGRIVERAAQADRDWTAAVSGICDVEELADGELRGMRAELPMIDTPHNLSWLRGRLDRLGVQFERRLVTDLGELTGTDLVVVAAGLRGPELLGDDNAMYPVAGQVVRLANPGLTEWLLDDDNPDGMVYVVPRRDDVVVGGTADVHSFITEPDPDVESQILQRAIPLVPELEGCAVLGRAVGNRPARPTIRLGWVPLAPVPTIAAYGHGGAGVTLSWGTAARVAALARDL